jgi:hypothetical protein
LLALGDPDRGMGKSADDVFGFGALGPLEGGEDPN